MINWKCKHCAARVFGGADVLHQHVKVCPNRSSRTHHSLVETKFKIGDRVCNHNTRTCVKGTVTGFDIRYIVKEDGQHSSPHFSRRAEYLKLEPVDPLVEAKAKIAALEARVSELESRNAGWAEGI